MPSGETLDGTALVLFMERSRLDLGEDHTQLGASCGEQRGDPS